MGNIKNQNTNKPSSTPKTKPTVISSGPGRPITNSVNPTKPKK